MIDSKGSKGRSIEWLANHFNRAYTVNFSPDLSEVLIISKVELARVISCIVSNLNSCSLVVAYALLEEVGLSLQRDHVHPLEWVLHIVVLGDSKLE